ncbi:fumarylacetoacetate hydrolase family protein [Xylariales sp. PMI_506]|nr:fumarylacetoacetate hydrolase family protein [Xylariales sp. PMI_506]
MSSFSRLIKFEGEDGKAYFADLGKENLEPPALGSKLKAFPSFQSLLEGSSAEPATIKKLLAPLPRDDLPIYCVGANYKSHVQEASLKLPKHPPLWPKPAAALANPGQDVIMNQHCASSFPDYEGELVFITSKECKDVTPAQAADLILGYTLGNDLSCRLFQLPDQCGGQFFYAKAFDNFAPVGPVLVSKDLITLGKDKMVTRVNGQVRQEADFIGDMIFDPATVLSFMSQCTTIPAYTAVMTGCASGVGAFMTPKTFLNNGDVVEVVLPGVGELKNKIVFHHGWAGWFYLLVQRFMISIFTRR